MSIYLFGLEPCTIKSLVTIDKPLLCKSLYSSSFFSRGTSKCLFFVESRPAYSFLDFSGIAKRAEIFSPLTDSDSNFLHSSSLRIIPLASTVLFQQHKLQQVVADLNRGMKLPFQLNPLLKDSLGHYILVY